MYGYKFLLAFIFLVTGFSKIQGADDSSEVSSGSSPSSPVLSERSPEDFFKGKYVHTLESPGYPNTISITGYNTKSMKGRKAEDIPYQEILSEIETGVSSAREAGTLTVTSYFGGTESISEYCKYDTVSFNGFYFDKKIIDKIQSALIPIGIKTVYVTDCHFKTKVLYADFKKQFQVNIRGKCTQGKNGDTIIAPKKKSRRKQI